MLYVWIFIFNKYMAAFRKHLWQYMALFYIIKVMIILTCFHRLEIYMKYIFIFFYNNSCNDTLSVDFRYFKMSIYSDPFISKLYLI